MNKMRWFNRAVLVLVGSLIAGLGFPTSGLAQASSNTRLSITNNQSPITLVVSPTGPYTTITAALQDAEAGDTIEVRGGAYGALTVDKSVTLEGVGAPVVDGGGVGTVVALTAPNITLRGFTIQGSGINPDTDDAGIHAEGMNARIEQNRLRDVLFGIFVDNADNAILRANDIASKPELEEGRRGDSVRVWYSANVLIEGNQIHDSRDVVLWYAANITVRDNVIEHGRYAIHLMYCNGATLERNEARYNSVGIFTMYSTQVVLRDNVLRGQRGPSGYALGFKDAEAVQVTNNVLVDNRAAVFLDGTPFSPAGQSLFTQNVIAFNDTGVIVMPATRGNTFSANTFWENETQMAIAGGNATGQNTWDGNYWSDYTGYDLDGDAVGDVPYRAERFFESLTDREPMLRTLLYSPVAQALELAATTFPIVRPQPKLVDNAPQMTPGPIPAWAFPNRPPSNLSLAALILLGLTGLSGGLAIFRGVSMTTAPAAQSQPTFNLLPLARTTPHAQTMTHVVQVANLTKRYGKFTALNHVSFEIKPGEAIALWGANGAGKSTLIKALLGLITFEGTLHINGQDVRRQSKLARRAIGYVPQEMAFYDLSVQATLEFYAQLKKIDVAKSEALAATLGLLGLTPHVKKLVNTLSGGLKQRLALALALLADPPILLLDEPTASLDAQAQRDYLTLLAQLRKNAGKTILFASHRLEEVEALASRVFVLEQGQLVAILTPAELRQRLVGNEGNLQA